MRELAGQGKDLLRFITCGSVDDGKSHIDRTVAVRFTAFAG